MSKKKPDLKDGKIVVTPPSDHPSAKEQQIREDVQNLTDKQKIDLLIDNVESIWNFLKGIKNGRD